MEIAQPNPSRESLVADMRRAYSLGAFGLVFIALSILGFGALERAALHSIFESRELMKLARQTSLLAVDRETSVRGFLLTRNQLSLEPERAAKRALSSKLDSMIRLSGRNASRKDRAESVQQSLDRWERGYLIPALSDGAGAVAVSRQQALAGKELFDSVRASFASFIQSEERLYQRRTAFEGFVVRFAIAVLLLEILFVVWMMRRLNRRVVTQAEQVIEQQDQLEDQAVELEQQAAELEAQAMSLEQQNLESRLNAEAVDRTNNELTATVSQLELSRDESRRLAAKRERAETLLAFILDSSPVGFGLFDKSLRFTLANEAMAVINDMPAADLIGKSPRDLASSDLADAVEKLLTGVMESGEPVLNVPLSGSTRAKPAIERFWLISYFPVRSGPDKETLGVGIMVTEVTDRKHLEDQLQEAQKMEAVGRLAGGIAHDFNNLLTAIKSYSELLLSDMEESNPQKADVMEINNAADRAAALTRQLLAFSRQQILRPEVMNLDCVVHGMEGMLRQLAGPGIRIETRLPEVGSVNADPAQVERVITNLVMNSRDSMPHGGTITIETANVELDEDHAFDFAGASPGPHVMLAVSDTGSGMTKEVKEKLFEPFFTTKPHGKGTGLGLSTVYGIVKQSGGHVWVYSEPEKGSTFKVYLPRNAASTDMEMRRSRGNKSSGGATIILVEDDEVVRNVTCRILKRAGFAVLEAENGASALELYEAMDFAADLIVTDIAMPEMGGSELAERIAKLDRQTKVLFMSGYTEDKVTRDHLLSPGAAFIEKPFTPDALTRKVREILDAPAPRGAAA